MTDYVREEMLSGDVGHYGFPHFPPARNVGGPFYLRKSEWHLGVVNVGEIYRGGPLDYSYKGSMACGMDTTYGWVTSNYSPGIWGAQAYNRMKPTTPNFNLGNAAYELRELPSMVRGGFLDPKHPLKSIGDYWLALKFGWEPLLRDCINLFITQQTIERRLKQLLKDNGRPVRRKVMIYDTSTDPARGQRSDIIQTFLPGLVTQYYAAPYTQAAKAWDFDRVWASAQFRYWLPEGPQDINWTRAMKARLFGLYPAPSVIWNALPWTWLIDWFGGVGDVLENMEAGVANRLAADYFFMMRERGARREVESSVGYRRRSGEIVKFQATSYSQWVHKNREMGDPFGFNTQLPLSGMQLSILGALGASKLR
jgi:hypothetical protein